MKWGRTYAMTVQIATEPAVGPLSPDNTLIIDYPITLEFDIVRSTLSSAGTAYFRVYNLTPSHRGQIHHDWWETLDLRRVTLAAGYTSEPRIPLIFDGNIQAAASRRQGPNWVTEIHAYVGLNAMQNGQVSLGLGSGFDVKQALLTAIGQMPGLKAGAVADFAPPQSERGLSISGSAWQAVQTLAQDGECFVDNGLVHVLHDHDYIAFPGPVPLINSDSGLLDTPRQYVDRLDVDVLFSPDIVVGQLVQLETEEAAFSGDYIVKGLHHRGVISGAVNGDLRTTLSLWNGNGGVFTGIQLQ